MTKRDDQAADYAAERWNTPPHALGGKVAAALGIEKATSLTLKFEVGMLPIVEATILPAADAIADGVHEITSHRWLLYPMDTTTDSVRSERLHASIMTGGWHRRGHRWLRALWLWFLGK